MNSTVKNQLTFVFLFIFQFFYWPAVNGQNVNYVPLNTSSSINNKTIDVNLPSGVVPGEASVSATGGAAYSIPIAVPPGTNEIAPSIAVVYSSMMGNGTLGQGWSIAGLSSITRIGQSFHFDGKRTPVNFTSTDRFQLDGGRLTLRTGTYGDAGSTYRKELDDFSVITAHGNMNGSPEYFKVEGKDGTVMEYGNSSDSRFLNQAGNEVLIWRLNRISYPDGNYIQYDWTSGDRDNRIREIKYTGNSVTGMTPYNLVKFHYKVRTDQNTIYEAGSSMTNRYLLDRIEVKAESQTVKNYYFHYSFDNFRSFLNSIQETGSNGTALNKTVFKYGDRPARFSTEVLTTFQGQNTDLFSGDFDGDGYTDILSAPASTIPVGTGTIRYNTALEVYKRTASNPTYSRTYQHPLTVGSTVINGINVPGFHNFITSDFTGDGRDDIMTVSMNLSSSRKLLYLELHTSTGSSFVSTKLFPPSPFNFISHSLQFFYPGDFNGDGITDYILFLSNRTGYKSFMTLGGTNIRNVEISGIGGYYSGSDWVLADDVRVLDFDGDGKMELMQVLQGSTKIYTFQQNGNAISGQLLYSAGFPTEWHRIQLGDFNGDRKTDLLVRNSKTNNQGTWELCHSTGTTFSCSNFTFQKTPDLNGTFPDHKLEVGDFNGDGKTDILHGWEQGASSILAVYYSRGTSFQFEMSFFNGSLGVLPLLQSDLNGDGRAELINRTTASSAATVFHFKKEGQELLLQNVVDGHLKRTNFSYRRMTEASNFYTRPLSTSYPRNTVTMPIYLASQLEQDDGIGGYFTTQYKYDNALVLRTGKGFLGFREFHAIDLTNDVRTEVEKTLDYNIYILAPYQVRKYVHSTNYQFHRTEYQRSFLPRSNQSHWLRIDGITERLLLQGQTKTMTYAYDSHGNVLQEVENNGVETITTTNAYGPFGGSIPNRLIRMDVNRQRAGQAPHLFSDRYNYNSKGQLTSKVDYSGLPHQVTTTYVYNDLGNVTIKTLSASGLAPRQTRKGYDSKGRFVINMTNPLGYSESATYGSKWGEKRSVTGIDGLTTTFDYDAFGRRTRTNLPTGVVINERFLFAVVPSYGSTYSHNISQVGKPDQWVYFDRLGRKLRHHRKSHANATVYEIWTFDSRGRLKTVRAPYKSGESTFTTTYQYDNYNRRISESNPFGTTSYVYSYSGGQSKVTKTDPAGQLSSVEMDASGQKTKATDNGGTLRYTYDSQGNIREIRLGNTVMVQMSHDVYGNKVQIVDKNAGTISYGYSPFKEMIHQTNANGHTYTMFYNACGKIIRRLGPGEDLHYTYHSTGAAKNKIANILNHQSPNGEYFYYDTFGRVNRKVDYIDGLYLSTFYTHNSFNDITSRLYPSGLKLDYAYDMNGFLSTIKHAASNQTLFTNQAMNGREQYTSYQLGNQQKTTIAYNQGVPFWYNAPGIQNLYLDWDYSSGNLNYRYDASKGQIEVFSYDNLNRLTSARVAGSPAKNVSFGTNGNINSKTDVGNYFYTSAKNNAVTRVTNPSRVIPTVRQNIRYTAFDQPDQLTEGNYELDYVYGHDRQRTKSVLQSNGAVETTRWYSGEYERQVTQSTTQEIHYVNAGQGTVAIVVKENNAFQFYYTYTDHLGSILAVTDAGGGVVAEQNFDPWGRKRNVFSWDYAGVGSVPDWLYRGYTGHEDMPEFGLINMNGRLYDPIVGRMLSVDNHIQSPSNTQSYNRYTYVFNNPLSYTDPSGELAWFVPVIIGATVGAYAGASIASNNWNFTKWEGDFWKGAIVGAFIGAAAGAMFAASVGAKGIIIPATGKATKGWSITTAALKGANIKMGVTLVSGGDLDKLYKAALVGAVLGGFKGVSDATKMFGIKHWGWKASLMEKAVYTTAESLGGNLINGDGIFDNIVIGVGPLRFTFGEKYGNPIWRWQDNIGSLLSESIHLLNGVTGGDVAIDWDKLSLSSSGGILEGFMSGSDPASRGVTFATGKDWLSFLGQLMSKLGSS